MLFEKKSTHKNLIENPFQRSLLFSSYSIPCYKQINWIFINCIRGHKICVTHNNGSSVFDKCYLFRNNNRMISFINLYTILFSKLIQQSYKKLIYISYWLRKNYIIILFPVKTYNYRLYARYFSLTLYVRKYYPTILYVDSDIFSQQ